MALAAILLILFARSTRLEARDYEHFFEIKNRTKPENSRATSDNEGATRSSDEKMAATSDSFAPTVVKIKIKRRIFLSSILGSRQVSVGVNEGARAFEENLL